MGGIIYAIGGVIEALVGLRFVLEFIGANSSNQIVDFIYTWSTPFIAPFAGIFGQNAVISGQGVVTTSVLDWTALIALVVYAVVFGIIGRLLGRGSKSA